MRCSNRVTQAFLYNGSTYTTFNQPGASYTEFNAIDGNNIVGISSLGSFLYNDGTYTLLPLVEGEYTPYAYGISGNYIVGDYQNGNFAQAFLYNISSETYTTLNIPGAVISAARGIDGNNIVGIYEPTYGSYGFLATPVPEPSIFGLLLLGAGAFFYRRRLAANRRI